MAIVNYTYYSQTYCGETIAQEDFPQYEARAERQIVQITHGRAANFAALPAFQQVAIENAICCQVEFLLNEGIEITVNGTNAGGWTVGKVRVDKGNGKSVSVGASMISAGAIAELEQTGLLNPQVPTVGDPILLPFPWGVV